MEEKNFNKHYAITSIVNTLNGLEVKGYDNCTAVVGCIQILKKLDEELTKEDQRNETKIETLMKHIDELEKGSASNESNDCDNQ